MLNYFIKHILGALLSLWIISMLIFFLSKAVPGDPVGGLKEANETNYSIDYEKEYKRKAISLGLNLPSFYFSVIPRNFPENLNELMPVEKKTYVKSLLFDGYQYSDVLNYISSLEEILNNQEATLIDLKNKLRLTSSRNKSDPIGFQKEINLFKDSLKNEAAYNNWLIINSHLDQLIINRKRSVIPKFYWHGLQNQYHIWISSLIKGKPGISRIDGKPVSQKISRALVWTLFMIIIALTFSYIIGVLLGLILAYIKKNWLKRLIERILFGIYAIPIFWLATLLLVFFTTKEYGTWTNIFPSVGLAPIDTGDPWYSRITAYGKQLILPCFILIVHSLAFVSTLVKRNVEKYKHSGFVLMAKAYGYNEKEILWREIFPHTLLPIITSITSAIPTSIAGSLVIEIIFNIPGVGRLLYTSINTGDWPVVFAIVMLIAMITIVSFFSAEILYRWADPRIKQNA